MSILMQTKGGLLLPKVQHQEGSRFIPPGVWICLQENGNCFYFSCWLLLEYVFSSYLNLTVSCKFVSEGWFWRAFNSDHSVDDRFDEVHFGKFASRYIKTRYFVDVHPPLAKLLITFAAFVFGYNGDFDFKDIAK